MDIIYYASERYNRFIFPKTVYALMHTVAWTNKSIHDHIVHQTVLHNNSRDFIWTRISMV